MMYWKRTFKRPAVILIWSAIPFVFMVLYTLVFDSGGKIPPSVLAVADRDSSFVSGFVADAFAQGPLEGIVAVKKVADLDEAQKMFEKNLASAALVIPDGFGTDLFLQKNIELLFYTNPRHYIGPQILQGTVETMAVLANGLLKTFRVPLKGISGFINNKKSPSADDLADVSRLFFTAGEKSQALSSLQSLDIKIIEKESAKAYEFNMAAFFFPGLIVFALLALSLGLEARFLGDRLEKLNNLIIASPQKPWLLVMNQRLYSICFLYFIAVICSLLGGAIWHIAPTGILKANIMTVLVIFFIVGMNATIFSIARSRKSSAALSSFIMTILMMIGGGIMPVEIYPPAVKKIANLTPTGIANTGIVESITGRDISISLPLLFAYCSTFLLLSIVVGRKKMAQN